MIKLYLLYLLVLIHFFKVSSEGTSSLAFVIDDTRSMKDEIIQVNNEIDSIMDIVLKEKSSQIKDIVLVTFNDPDVILRKKTRSRKEIKAALKSVKVGNFDNYDCPEVSLAGIERALEESLPSSYIYVFTDAPAKDYNNLTTIKRICQNKQSQITFVVTGDCGKPESEGIHVYYDIAAASDGQVYNISKKEVGQLIQVFKEMINGKHSTYLSKNVPSSEEYTEMPFSLDDKTDFAIVTASGKNTMLKIRGPSLRTKKIMWADNVKVVKLIDPVPGKYIAEVKGSGATNVVIYGRTDFTFKQGFSQLEPERFEDTALQPVASNTENYLSIQVTDSYHEISIESVQILDVDENVLKKMSLDKKGEDFYCTPNILVTPADKFKIAVLGKVKKTGKPIRRLSKPIEPQINSTTYLEIRPVVNITEGFNVETEYGSDIVLTCKVVASPEPTIVWNDSKGAQKISDNSTVAIPKDFISYLRLTNVKHTETYSCEASNEVGTEMASVNVTVRSPFTVNSYPTGVKQVKYGNETTLKCNITSSSPMTITWYLMKNMKNIMINSSDLFALSADGTELKIKSMDTDLEGEYTCKAWITDDETTNLQYSVQVKAHGIEPPIIAKKTVTVQVKEHDNASITCSLKSGVPPPKITWQHKPKSSDTFLNLDNMKDSSLNIDDASIDDSGYYKCIANNIAGTDEHVTELIVEMKPVVKISDGPLLFHKYGSVLIVKCKVTGNPPLRIAWKDSEGNNLANKTETSNEFVYELKLHVTGSVASQKYYCFSENDQGISYDDVDVESISPLIVGDEPDTKEIEYGTQETLYCNITSTFPLIMKWYKFNEKTKQKVRINDSKIYTIMAKRTKLRIKFKDMDLFGQYICEAQMLFDNNQKAEYSMNVTVRGMGPPVIDNIPAVVEVKENEIAIIPCRLLKGIPPPDISWEFMKHNSSTYERISGDETYLRFTKVTFDNVGRYRCTAKNTIGSDEKITELVVNKAPVASIVEGSKIKVKYNSTLSLTCKVTAHPEPNITWKDDKGTPIPSKKVTLTLGIEYSSVLEKPNVMQSSKYYCFAENNQGMTNAEVDVSVESSIKVLQPLPGTTYFEYNKTARIPCNVTSDSPIKITWFHVNNKTGHKEPISESTKLEISNDGMVLTILSMDIDLVGQYSCKAESDGSKAIELKTDVKITGLISPVIILENNTRSYQAVEGDVVLRIPCNATGYPKPVITWKTEDKVIATGEKYSIEDEGLIINKPIEKDTNSYTCEARNDVGVDKIKFEGIVTPYLDDLGEEHIVYVLEGETKKIKCNLPYSTPDSVRWFVNELPTNIIGPYNELIDANVLMDGNYSCRVSDRRTAATETFVVDVGYPPEFRNKIENVKWRGDNDEIINCDARAKPAAKAEWLLNGNPVEVTDPYLLTLNITKLGVYTCRVSNVHGSIKKEVNVTSSVCLLNRKTEFKPNSPILLTRPYADSRLRWPEFEFNNEILIIDSGEEVTLACPTHNSVVNKFQRFPDKNEIDIKCNHEDKFQLDEKEYTLSQFDCKEEVKPIVLNTGESCMSEKSELLKVGFNASMFVGVYDVCHNSLTSLFARSVIYSMNNIGPGVEQNWFIYEDIGKGAGNESYTCMDDSSNCCYAKQQMINALDVGYGAPQISTYIDHVNSVSVWRQCPDSNRVSWEKIEEAVRHQLSTISAFAVWTGASNFEKNEKGGLVPRYLWKLVFFDESDSMVVIYVNHPSPVDSDIRCHSTCAEKKLKDLPCQDKFTYTCNLDDFLDGFDLPRKALGG